EGSRSETSSSVPQRSKKATPWQPRTKNTSNEYQASQSYPNKNYYGDSNRPATFSLPSNLAGIGAATRLVPSDGCPVILLIVRETLPVGSCPEGDLPSSLSQDRICRTCSEERRLECGRLFESRAT